MTKKILIKRIGGQGFVFEAEKEGDMLTIFDGCDIIEQLKVSEVVFNNGRIFYKGTDLDGFKITYIEV